MPLLSPAEQSQLEAWNQTAAELPQERCFPDLFREQVRRVPDAVAVTCGDLSLSYATLAAASRRLAEEIAAAGLGREEVAIVLAERGPELLAAMIALFEAGGVYLPLDPHQPVRRLARMVEQSGARLVLATAGWRGLCDEMLAGLAPDRRPQV